MNFYLGISLLGKVDGPSGLPKLEIFRRDLVIVKNSYQIEMMSTSEILKLQKQLSKYEKDLDYDCRETFRSLVEKLGDQAYSLKSLFEKQKDIIRDDRYCECSVCGIKVHDEDVTFCEKCEDGITRATCDDCASEFASFSYDFVSDALKCSLCDTPIKVKPIDRELKVYL